MFGVLCTVFTQNRYFSLQDSTLKLQHEWLCAAIADVNHGDAILQEAKKADLESRLQRLDVTHEATLKQGDATMAAAATRLALLPHAIKNMKNALGEIIEVACKEVANEATEVGSLLLKQKNRSP